MFKQVFPTGTKILYFDLETTGLHKFFNGVVQIAGIIEVDNVVCDQFNYLVKPFPDDEIDPKALEIQGLKDEDFKQYIPPRAVHESLKKVLSKYVDPFKKGKTVRDKFFPAGFNVRFDLDFLNEWFKKCGDKFFGSWQNWRMIDPVHELCKSCLYGDIDFENYKLETVAKEMNIEIKAHDAMSDIQATRKIIRRLCFGFDE